MNDKIDMDEEIVRHALLRAWLKLLDKYATPGACIPSAQEVHKEMLKKGVDAAVKALGDEHWFAFRWVI
ncbi:MAG: hypothetical protein KGQ49_04610, partial [Verrucomicrobia bacterium]|nr:hypothetical protein [Verrucomicrobiota bacterium]